MLNRKTAIRTEKLLFVYFSIIENDNLMNQWIIVDMNSERFWRLPHALHSCKFERKLHGSILIPFSLLIESHHDQQGSRGKWMIDMFPTANTPETHSDILVNKAGRYLNMPTTERWVNDEQLRGRGPQWCEQLCENRLKP
jgi:hypothetical protein